MSQRSRRGLATWLTSSQTPVFVLDERSVVLVFNRGCEELTQWPAADIIGKRCSFETEVDPDRVTSVTSALCPPGPVAPGQAIHRRTVIHRRDGTIQEREIHYFLLEQEGDRSQTHLLGIITEPTGTPATGDDPQFDVRQHLTELYRKYGVDRLVARTPAMQKVAGQIELARETSASVFLLGERGTGREHVARLIHYASSARQKRFVPISCAKASHFELHRTLTRLVESPARENVGTIYLGEVDRLPGDLQQLALQQMEQAPQRWMSSSQVELDKLSDQEFSPLLRLRLTSLTIQIPPLRSRSADFPLLAQQLLEEAAASRVDAPRSFSPAVMRLLQEHSWPGNVDELARVIYAACSACSGPVIDQADLPYDFAASLHARTVRPVVIHASLDEELAEFERSRILQALQQARGNKSVAAERLGIPRARLYRRLEQLGLELEQGQNDAKPQIE